MWDFICDWLPIVAFISGTALGWLINALFERVRRKHLEKLYQNTSNANAALESQLISKSRLERDLGRTNSELEELRRDVKALSVRPEQKSSMDIENNILREKIQKLQLKPARKIKQSVKSYVTEYQSFLSDLEASIKKAKEKTSVLEKIDKKEIKKNKSKKAKGRAEKSKSAKKKSSKKNKKNKSKYDFYKQKFSAKSATGILNQQTSTTRDLTYLYGIDSEIQDILNENEILTYTDLSNSKISELRAILTIAGDKYKKVDPLNWPIQARIAEKGQWEILDEYKSKMEM